MSDPPAIKDPSSAKAPDDRAERLSTEALEIPFVGRHDEMHSAVDYLAPFEPTTEGRAVVVHGDSGTGKTFFARELMRGVLTTRPEALALYIDIANDEYQSSRTIASLLKMCLVSGPMTGTSTISVPAKISLARYRRQARNRGVGRGLLRAIARALGTVLGIGGAVGAALDETSHGGSPQLEDELARYLSWAAKKEVVLLAIDNIQFLNLELRLALESVLQRVEKNLRLVMLDRTSAGKTELDPPIRCFAGSSLEIFVGHLTAADTREIVAKTIGGDPSSAVRLADDIFSKTEGLAKDIEYCLRQYALQLGRGVGDGAVEGLLATVDRLPLIHRQFLMTAVLLDGGVKEAIARGTVRRLASVYDTSRLDGAVQELLAREYLRLNSDSNDRLRPGHERIAIALRELADEDLHEDVRRSLIAELVAALEAPDADENETYLLHCLVGLQTAHELSRNLEHISRLIQSQYRQDQFSYLVAIADELLEILPLLPEHVLNDLLDAMQKSSAFEKGLQVVALLDSKEVPGTSGRRIHRLKYLTQAYRYDEALALSEELGSNDWGDVYRVNALLALSRFREASVIAQAQLAMPMSEPGAVMRRNTITLFDVARAMQHLDEAYDYFDNEESGFRLATVDTNRGLVCLSCRRLGDAGRYLNRAAERMESIKSREVYQALVNLAIRAALTRDYASAIAMLDDAAVHVPRALILDQVKIDMNRTVVEYINGDITIGACESAIIGYVQRIRGLQMPYLRAALLSNLAIARSGASPEDPARGLARGPVAVEIDLAAGTPESQEVPWTLLMSIHWRY